MINLKFEMNTYFIFHVELQTSITLQLRQISKNNVKQTFIVNLFIESLNLGLCLNPLPIIQCYSTCLVCSCTVFMTKYRFISISIPHQQ